MNFKTGRPDHIEDYLVDLHTGGWFGWSNPKNKVYTNLIIHDDSKDKPTEQECIDGLVALQASYDDNMSKIATDKTNANNKLKALGLTDDEIKEIKGIE